MIWGLGLFVGSLQQLQPPLCNYIQLFIPEGGNYSDSFASFYSTNCIVFRSCLLLSQTRSTLQHMLAIISFSILVLQFFFQTFVTKV